MADNPYMDITNGIQTGVDYAFKKSQLELQQQTLQDKMGEQQQQRQAIQLAKVGKVMDNVDKISQETRPGVKKALIAKFNTEAQTLGIPVDSVLTAALQDDSYSEKFGQFTQNFFQLSDQDKLKMAPDIFKNLGTGDGLKLLDQTNKRLNDYNTTKLTADATAQGNADKADAKADTQFQKNITKFQEALDPNKARAGNLAASQANYLQAQRLQGLVQSVGNGNMNLDSRQIEELAIGVNKLLSGASGGAVAQVQALVPKTIQGNSQKIAEWLSNTPTGTNQQAFVKRMMDTVNREQEIAADQVKKAQTARLPAYSFLAKSNPEEYNAVLRGYKLDDYAVQTDADKADAAQSSSKAPKGNAQTPPAAPGAGSPPPQQTASAQTPPAPPADPLSRFSSAQRQALGTLAGKKFSARVIQKQTGLQLSPGEIKALGLKE